MKKLLDGYFWLLKIVLTLLMAILIVPVSMQIASRYLGIIPRYIWTEELARFCFIWIIMIGAIIAIRENEHFTVDLLPKPTSVLGAAAALIFVDLMCLILAIVFLFWGWPLVKFGLLQTSEMAELPMVYIYAAWPITGLSWIVFLLERLTSHWQTIRGAHA